MLMRHMSIPPPTQRVLLAYSGGLDTSYLVLWLTREAGCHVETLSVDCGGWSSAEKQGLETRALALGAKAHHLVDARAELFERVLTWLVAANVRRGSVYPLSVGAERGLQAEHLARAAGDFDAVAHGCTGAGNDQVRFEAALATVAPHAEVLAPVRDNAPSRDEQRAYLAAAGMPVPPEGGAYSINAGLWGLTIGGGAMLTSDEPLPAEAWQWTQGGSGTRKLKLHFEAGVPTSIDGEALDPVALIETLNLEAGALGVGRGYHLGDTLLGIKGRIAFEAPAASVLLDSHRELEKLVLTEDQRFWKDHLGDVYGKRLHQGLFHDPFQRDLEAFFASSQSRVSGDVHVLLSGGAVTIEGVSSPFSLMSASDAQYGERVATGTSSSAAAGLGRVLAEPGRLFRAAQEVSA